VDVYPNLLSFYHRADDQPILKGDFEFRYSVSSCIAHNVFAMSPYLDTPSPFYWSRTCTVGTSRLLEAAVSYVGYCECLSGPGNVSWFGWRVYNNNSLPAFVIPRRRVTKTTPIIPRTAMRSFVVLFFIHFFLVLTRAVPVSNELSAKGSYPLVALSRS
jgi:hypothetical protein